MHNLYLGDCLEVLKKIPDKSVDLVLTDPPYGTTACKWDTIIPFNLMWAELNRVITSEGTIALFGSEPFSSKLRVSNIKNYRYDWIWNKNRATNYPNAKRRPMTKHENICVFQEKLFYYPQKSQGHNPTNSAKGCSQGSIYHGSSIRNYTGGSTERFPLTVIDFKCERGLHPTQKPVPLLEYLIKSYTTEGQTVLDFTMGSGSTGVACINTNRNFIGIEKEEKYFNIAHLRIEEAKKS